MILILKSGLSPSRAEGVRRSVASFAPQAKLAKNGRRYLVMIDGDVDGTTVDRIEAFPEVESRVADEQPFRRVSRLTGARETSVRVGGRVIGPKSFTLIAGPCSVESRSQILRTARAVKKAGAHILRGGAFKPRTSPYAFQGLGVEGLKLLAEAKRETGLPVVTEVLSPEYLDDVAGVADILQIGSRNMQNFPLLKAVGRARKPVLLKRGMMATLEEFLLAAEYIVSEGNPQVILCERGIRTFEPSTRNTLDISAVPLLQQMSHLPVIVDPSHASGRRSLIEPLSRAAFAAGADGLMIEVHPEPAKALSDGFESLNFREFERLVAGLKPLAAALRRPL